MVILFSIDLQLVYLRVICYFWSLSIGVNLTFVPQHFLELAGKGNPKYFNEEYFTTKSNKLSLNLTAALYLIGAGSILYFSIEDLINFSIDYNIIYAALSLSLKHKKYKISGLN